MTAATLERPKAKISTRRSEAAPGPSPIRNAFASIAVALYSAARAEDPECCSGDSNRLLEAGAVLAEHAAERDHDAENAQSVAFDIAAQIKASRLVLGDMETLERQDLIESARAHLVLLTGSEECIQPDPAPASQVQAGVHWIEIDCSTGEVRNARVLLDLLRSEAEFPHADPEAADLAQNRIILLCRAVDGYLKAAEDSFDQMVVKAREVGHA